MMVKTIAAPDARRLIKRPKPSKYKNRRCKEDGFSFDSEAEWRRYRELKLLLKGKRIDNLRIHSRYPFVVNGIKVGEYEADFSYTEKGAEVAEDCKGCATTLFKLKAKLFRALYPDHELRIIPA